MIGECLVDAWARVKGLGCMDLCDAGLDILVGRAFAHQMRLGVAEVLHQSARLIPAHARCPESQKPGRCVSI